MKMTGFAGLVLSAGIVCACDHSAAPVAPEASVTPPAEPVAEATPAVEAPPAASADVAAPSSPPTRGKRAPCTTDQSCNGDPTVSALWGRCVKETGVCECKPGFELHPGGSCQPNAK